MSKTKKRGVLEVVSNFLDELAPFVENSGDIERAIISELEPVDVYVSPSVDWTCPYCSCRNNNDPGVEDIQCGECGLRVNLNLDY